MVSVFTVTGEIYQGKAMQEVCRDAFALIMNRQKAVEGETDADVTGCEREQQEYGDVEERRGEGRRRGYQQKTGQRRAQEGKEHVPDVEATAAASRERRRSVLRATSRKEVGCGGGRRSTRR